MKKYSVWECDVCGCEEEADGYPREWINIEIRKGSYFTDRGEAKQEVEKDCCSQACANKAVLDYYSSHRLEVNNEL